jgi:hypothetical protein
VVAVLHVLEDEVELRDGGVVEVVLEAVAQRADQVPVEALRRLAALHPHAGNGSSPGTSGGASEVRDRFRNEFITGRSFSVPTIDAT